MEPTDQNREAWDEAHRRRAEDPAERGIPKEIRELLPDIDGKHVLHLQSGTGESTADLVAAGALVSAVDISAEALDAARERARPTSPTSTPTFTTSRSSYAVDASTWSSPAAP